MCIAIGSIWKARFEAERPEGIHLHIFQQRVPDLTWFAPSGRAS